MRSNKEKKENGDVAASRSIDQAARAVGLPQSSQKSRASRAREWIANMFNCADGRVAYAGINLDYTRRSEPSDVFPILDRLKAAQLASERPFERSDAPRVTAPR